MVRQLVKEALPFVGPGLEVVIAALMLALIWFLVQLGHAIRALSTAVSRSRREVRVMHRRLDRHLDIGQWQRDQDIV